MAPENVPLEQKRKGRNMSEGSRGAGEAQQFSVWCPQGTLASSSSAVFQFAVLPRLGFVLGTLRKVQTSRQGDCGLGASGGGFSCEFVPNTHSRRLPTLITG